MLKTSAQSVFCQTAIAIATSVCLTGAASAQSKIDFEISEGRVVPTEEFAAKVSVLGAAITSGGVDMPVTVRVNVGDSVFEPFGDFDNPVTVT
jgi:hypothetical protein